MSIIGSLVTTKLLGIALAAGLLFTAATGVVAYRKGVASDKQRSGLVIAKLQRDAAEKLASANKLIKGQGDALQANKERAEHDLQVERDIAAQWVADAVAAERVRGSQLAAFARGPGAAADTIATCRSEASALGDVLDRALLAHRVCSGHAEAEAGGARAMLSAWPKGANTAKAD